jgi:IrrE N-terminal-like domain
MTTTTTQPSVLASLRGLVPQRPLRFDEAVRIAEQQANRLLQLADLTDPPVPTELITDLPRIQVEIRGGMPVAGSAHWSDGRWVLCISASDHPRRQRFSVAHELKHVLDHPYRQFLYSGFPPLSQERLTERTADAFAGALLMPKRFVRQAFTAGIQDPYDLARLFDVSPAAMRVRLNALGLFPGPSGCGTTWGCRPQPTITLASRSGAR